MAPKSHNVKRESNTIIIIITNMNSSNLFLMVLRTLHMLTCLISAANQDGKYYHCHFTEKELRAMMVKKFATWTLYRCIE